MFTYDDTLSTPKDIIRAMLQDVDSDDVLFEDEHITAVYDLKNQVVGETVAYLADELIARFSRDPVRWREDMVLIDYTGRIPLLQQLAQQQRSASYFSSVPATYGESDKLDEYYVPYGTTWRRW